MAPKNKKSTDSRENVASHIKRILHRDKSGSRRSSRSLSDTEPAFHTVPYEMTSNGGPESGPYPDRSTDASNTRSSESGPDSHFHKIAQSGHQSPQEHPSDARYSIPSRKPVENPYVSSYGNTKQGGTAAIKVVDTAQLSAGPHIDRSTKQPRLGAESHRTKHGPGVQEVLNRAKGNSTETNVRTSVAPAVTHETVHHERHHVREEHITREIHNHELYHRIQPVIDVEVLPTRHFLPMGENELLEVDAEDVPGRAKTWVLAETMSKMTLEDPAPTEQRQFSARKFTNGEGDNKSYITPDGYEKTEQTWIHPPRFETNS